MLAEVAPPILSSAEEQPAALQISDALFRDPQGFRTLFSWRGDLYHWRGDHWHLGDTGLLTKAVVDWLSTATYRKTTKNGVMQRPAHAMFSVRQVRDMVGLIEIMSRVPYEQVPCWLPNDLPEYVRPPADHCVAFRNYIVDITGTVAIRRKGQSGYVVFPNQPGYFTPVTCTVDFDPHAVCPSWDAAMKQWSMGDPEWVKLRERAYGYALLPSRKYQKLILEYGKPRSGKGIGAAVLKAILGKPGFCGISMNALAGDFGLDGLMQSRVALVGEAQDLDRGAGRTVATVLKMIVGGDEMTLNIKYQRQLKGIEFRCLPILQSNAMLSLPNDAGGLSSKLVIIPFLNTFVGREDPGLLSKLLAELPGIATRFIEALVQLELEEDPAKKFPVLGEAAEVLSEYERNTNPFDAFLRWGFVASDKAWVDEEVIKGLRDEFEAETGIKLFNRQGRRLPDSNLLYELEHRSSWRIARKVSSVGVRGMIGLGPRADRYGLPDEISAEVVAPE